MAANSIEPVKRGEVASAWFLPGILIGLLLTGKSLVVNLIDNALALFGIRKRQVMPTINYPEEKYEYSPRFKGNHVLTVK